jgi:hypothetical protein
MEMLSRLPDELPDDLVRWAVDRFVNHREDWSPAINRAVAEGHYRAARARLRPIAKEILNTAVNAGREE